MSARVEKLLAKHESREAVRDLPRYTFTEAGRYLDIPVSTVRAWTVGKGYPGGHFEPLIEPAGGTSPNLSFNNLVEIFVLRALRQDHEVDMGAVRTALDFTERERRINRLFLSNQLLAAPGRIFLERLGEIEELTAPGQGVMAAMLEAHLQRFEWDREGFAEKFYPASRRDLRSSPKVIAIVPAVSFGRPIIDGTGVKASVVARRFEAGQSIRVLCDDFKLTPSQVEEALRWARRAA